MLKSVPISVALLALLASGCLVPASAQQTDSQAPGSQVLKGKAALGDWRQDKPRLRRHLTLQDLSPTFFRRTYRLSPPGAMSVRGMLLMLQHPQHVWAVLIYDRRSNEVAIAYLSVR